MHKHFLKCIYMHVYIFFAKLKTPILKRRSSCFFRHLNHLSIYKTDEGQPYLVYMHFVTAVPQHVPAIGTD